jgi:hypothetical protein
MGLPDQMCQATAVPAQIDMGQKMFRFKKSANLKNVQNSKIVQNLKNIQNL